MNRSNINFCAKACAFLLHLHLYLIEDSHKVIANDRYFAFSHPLETTDVILCFKLDLSDPLYTLAECEC